ncbi:MAG: FAD-dependent oxidoreductase [Kiritimatiellae bacterium]|nr:FAD-dependent oxidoreductase [Kiritimatiellia bacterium]
MKRGIIAAALLSGALASRAENVIAEVDVVIAGGTSYGVAAAVEAARSGRSVFLVAPRAALGEDLAGTLRLRPEDGAALPKEMREKLYAPNPKAKNSFGGATPLQIKKSLDVALLEAGVKFRCWLQPCDIVSDAAGSVTGLRVAGRDGCSIVKAREVIDATLYSALARRTGNCEEFSPGPVALARNVISGEKPRADGMSVTAISPVESVSAASDIALSPQLAPAKGSPTNVEARVWKCVKTFKTGGLSAREFARIEQEMRDATWTSDQVDAADFVYFAQPPPFVARAHRITKVKRRLPQGEAPLAETDVLVVGAGTAGAPAAIAAARAGAKVICVEFSGRVGGISTDGGIGRYCYGLRRGFTSEIEKGVSTVGTFYACRKAEWLRREGRGNGIEWWLCAQATGAVVEGGRVVGATVAMPDGTFGVVRAKATIDATGYALIAASAGERTEFLTGGELSVQGAGSLARLLGRSHLNTDAFFVDDADPADVSYEWLRARTSFGPWAWDQTSVVSSRERRRMRGAYRVSVQDALSGKTYPDLISLTCSNFDTHGQTVDPQFFIHIPERKKLVTARLPYRALLPEKMDGFLSVGLGMSADRDAMPVLRMQADLQNSGYAGGLAAAQAVRRGVELRDIDIGELQRGLVAKRILTEAEIAAESNPPTDQELAALVASLDYDDVALARALSDSARALPLLKRAYAESTSADRKLFYAHVLGALGDASGAETLAAAIDAAKWDDGWNYRGMGQFGASLSRIDAYLIALGCPENRGRADVANAIRRKAAALGPKDAYSHFRAVAKAAEGAGMRELASDLARLLALPGVGGHALAPDALPRIKGYAVDSTWIGAGNEERSECLRELALARALYRLGDADGLGERALRSYLTDPRRVYARHAEELLSEPPR